MNQKKVYLTEYWKQKKTRITFKNFEVTIFPCNLSKSISKSPNNMQVLSRGAILFKHSIKKNT